MPCIRTTTNVKISPEMEKALKEQLGEAVGLIPGKSERWLMATFSGGQPVYFAGEEGPAAFVEVKIFGRASASDYDRMTARLTEIVGGGLGIDPARIYVQYEETSHWGWNGANF